MSAMALVDGLLMASKFRGCMLGALVGDCLGFPYEDEVKPSYVVLQNFFDTLESSTAKAPQLIYTDDTAMTHCIAESLIKRKEVEARDLAKRFVKEYFKQPPNRGYGTHVQEVFHKLRAHKFEDPLRPAREQFGGSGSWGNGGAMRIAPIALFYRGQGTQLLGDMARMVTEVTHTHRNGINGAILQICDYDLNILNVNARYPGGTHDSFIWRSSNIYRALENAHSIGTLDGWLIGDSGYPLQPWLMTPVLNAIPGTPEYRCTEAHAAARNCIERCNGVLKSRFRCLLSERGLHYSPERASLIINTCVVIHNMCKRYNLEDDNIQLPPANRAVVYVREDIENHAHNEALRIRRQIIRARFS